jgi:L-ascorbate metabolism protein UlaG (beta-lactamase superfamily)
MKRKFSYLLRFFAVAGLVLAISVFGFAQQDGQRRGGDGRGRGGAGAEGGGGGDRGGGGGQARGPQTPPPPFKPTASDTLKTKDGDLKMTPVNHAGVMFQLGNSVLYADPVGNYSELPKADYILITDIHGDHMDANAVKTLSKPGTVVIAPPEVVKTITEAKPLANGANQTIKLNNKNVKLEAVPMYNAVRGPSAGQFYHTKGRGDGFVLNIGGKRVYLAGDTECTPEMKALKNIDVAFLPMNLPFTMTPAEAADCAKAFKPKVVYPYHYRDNDPSTEPQQFADALKDTKGVEVRMRNWY